MERSFKSIFMLDITWMQFGIAVVSAGLLYYLLILFKYYRLEINRLFQDKPKPMTKTAPAGPVFGAAQVNETEMNLVDEGELLFAESEPDEIKAQLLGGIADFMQELSVLLRITREECDTKENFLMLLHLLAGKHPDAASIRYGEPIALYLLEEGADLPFTLTKDEIENALIPDNYEN
jgi:hypothetical protein